MQAKLYAPNYPQRREAIFARSEGQCENKLAGGERCTVQLGDWRITHSHQLQFEQLLIHHPNGDPENPEAEMLAVCWACHMRLHRKPGPGRPKAGARKQGYDVIRVPYLMELLARAGFFTWPTPDGRVGWQIGTLASEANDSIDALTMALYWMAGEIRDLQNELDQLQENSTMPTSTQQERDIALRLHDAEQRRAHDQYIRQPRARSAWLADDAPALLSTMFDQAEACTAETSPCEQQEQTESLHLIDTPTQFAYAVTTTPGEKV
jgi:hypothetical protein